MKLLGCVISTGAAGLVAAGLVFGFPDRSDAQGTAPRPGGVETAPLPPPSGTAQATPPSPTPPASPPGPSPVPPAASAPTPPPAGGRATLVPNRGDPADVDEVTLTGKPAAVFAGSAKSDEGFTALQKAFQTVEEELRKAGIAPTGRPVTVFTQVDDESFRFEAMIPIERAPEGRPTLTPEIRFGTTPAGKALRFVHKGAYDDIESTYETIAAYLDAKGITVQDIFLEEYVTDLMQSADENLEVNIFALPK